MPLNEEFMEFVAGQLHGMENVTFKKMFGGAGIFHEGKMFGLLHRSQMYLKVNDTNRMEFEGAGSQRFQPFPNKPMKMPYYEVPPEVLEDSKKLHEWSKVSIRIAHG